MSTNEYLAFYGRPRKLPQQDENWMRDLARSIGAIPFLLLLLLAALIIAVLFFLIVIYCADLVSSYYFLIESLSAQNNFSVRVGRRRTYVLVRKHQIFQRRTSALIQIRLENDCFSLLYRLLWLKKMIVD